MTGTKYGGGGLGTQPIPAGGNLIGNVIVQDEDGDLISFDDITWALNTITYGHHEIHGASAYSVHVVDTDFDKSDEVNVCFTTPNTTRWSHMVPLVTCSTYATFDILEGPTITAGTGSAYAPRNRNRNSANTSTAWSMAASPVQGQVTLNATIVADVFVLHTEVLGGGKNRSGAGGIRDSDEYVLKQNTTYAFRLKGTGAGADNNIGGMEIGWYEHTNK